MGKTKMKQKSIFLLAGFFALTAVMLGAFATHGLKAHLSSSRISIFETGVHYQYMHAMGLFIIGLLMHHNHSAVLSKAALIMILGIILFSGSLYLLAARSVLGIESWTWLGPITPLGGLSFMVAWIFVMIAVWRSQ